MNQKPKVIKTKLGQLNLAAHSGNVCVVELNFM